MMGISQGRDWIFLHQLSRIDPMSKHQPTSHMLNNTKKETTPAVMRPTNRMAPVVTGHRLHCFGCRGRAQSSEGLRARRNNRIPYLVVVIVIMLAYSIIHGLVRYAATPTLVAEDSLSLVYAQDWAFGYTSDKPPLYIWMLAGVQTLTGANLTAVLVLKYGLLIATTVFTYLAASHVLRNPLWATLTALSLSLCFEIGWTMHEGVTYAAALTTMIMATMWIFLRLCDKGTWIDYLFFGIFCALGLLSNYNFVIFLITLILSSFSLRSSQRRLRNPRALLSLCAGLALVAPFCVWLIVGDRTADGFPQTFNKRAAVPALHSHGILKDNPPLAQRGGSEQVDIRRSDSLHRSMTQLDGRFGQLLKKSYIHRSFTALLNMLQSPLIFLFPLFPILPLVFPGLMTNLGKACRTLGREGLENDYERLVLRMTLSALALLMLAVLVGFDRGGSQYMHPLFLPTVLLVVAIAKHQMRSPRQIYMYALTILAVASITLGFRVYALFIGPPICGSCETWERFDSLADVLRREGAENATILTTDRMAAGNLHQLLPMAHVVIAERRKLIPQHQSDKLINPIAVITRAEEGETGRGLDLLCGVYNKRPMTGPSRSLVVVADWRGHHWEPASRRQSVWHVSIYKSGEACPSASAAPIR
jgi:4-amino-4-deoxy-L-arabinose transferase-like glycosyltransferase